MQYKPNFQDPRVKKRMTSVLAWCDVMRTSKKVRHVHHDELLKIFGNTSRGFGQWLYANLLSQHGHYVPGKQSFSYRLKQVGYDKLHGFLDMIPPTEAEVVKKEYGSLIEGTVSPVYKDAGQRRYHPAQNIKREVRRSAFAGWWDYDIETCAPTLIHQYAVQKHWSVYPQERLVEPYPAVLRSIRDKKEIRAHIAALTGLDAQTTKSLILAMFFRASMAPFHKARIFQWLGCDLVRHQKLINDPFVRQFRGEIRKMWFMARHHDFHERGQQMMRGMKVPRRPAKASKHRMYIYLKLERRVIDVMLEHLEATGVSVFLMHDGFMGKKRANVDELVKAVADKTGFAIRLSEGIIGASADTDVEPDVMDISFGDSL